MCFSFSSWCHFQNQTIRMKSWNNVAIRGFPPSLWNEHVRKERRGSLWWMNILLVLMSSWPAAWKESVWDKNYKRRMPRKDLAEVSSNCHVDIKCFKHLLKQLWHYCHRDKWQNFDFSIYSWQHRWHRVLLLGHGCSVHSAIFPAELCFHRIWC